MGIQQTLKKNGYGARNGMTAIDSGGGNSTSMMVLADSTMRGALAGDLAGSGSG